MNVFRKTSTVLIITAMLCTWQMADVLAATSDENPGPTGSLSDSGSLEHTGRGHIEKLSGDVVIVVGKQAARRAQQFDPIVSDTYVNTGDRSSAELKFEDGETIDMQSNSTLHVRQYQYSPGRKNDNRAVFSMFQGVMRFVTGLIGQQNKEAFRLSTPNATVGIRGTDFIVAIRNGQVYIQVISGSVTITSAAGTITLSAGETAAVSTATAVPAKVPASEVPNDLFVDSTQVNLENFQANPPAQPEQVSGFDSTPGGASEGGAAFVSKAAPPAGGVSGTAIAIGVGVAGGIAALVSTSTTHH